MKISRRQALELAKALAMARNNRIMDDVSYPGHDVLQKFMDDLDDFLSEAHSQS